MPTNVGSLREEVPENRFEVEWTSKCYLEKKNHNSTIFQAIYNFSQPIFKYDISTHAHFQSEGVSENRFEMKWNLSLAVARVSVYCDCHKKRKRHLRCKIWTSSTQCNRVNRKRSGSNGHRRLWWPGYEPFDNSSLWKDWVGLLSCVSIYLWLGERKGQSLRDSWDLYDSRWVQRSKFTL